MNKELDAIGKFNKPYQGIRLSQSEYEKWLSRQPNNIPNLMYYQPRYSMIHNVTYEISFNEEFYPIDLEVFYEDRT